MGKVGGNPFANLTVIFAYYTLYSCVHILLCVKWKGRLPHYLAITLFSVKIHYLLKNSFDCHIFPVICKHIRLVLWNTEDKVTGETKRGKMWSLNCGALIFLWHKCIDDIYDDITGTDDITESAITHYCVWSKGSFLLGKAPKALEFVWYTAHIIGPPPVLMVHHVICQWGGAGISELLLKWFWEVWLCIWCNPMSSNLDQSVSFAITGTRWKTFLLVWLLNGKHKQQTHISTGIYCRVFFAAGPDDGI